MNQLIYRVNENMPFHELANFEQYSDYYMIKLGENFKKKHIDYEVLLVDIKNWKVVKEF